MYTTLYYYILVQPWMMDNISGIKTNFFVNNLINMFYPCASIMLTILLLHWTRVKFW
jgi:hypothetical protein